MIYHNSISNSGLRRLVRLNKIKFGGNAELKIYGMLSCSSGKRMKKGKRVFFAAEADALRAGYRPCGHCLRQKYNSSRLTT
ncbi:MAG: Ada metal-binding domain-containing protein [Cyclobacteriaceae bacterium]